MSQLVFGSPQANIIAAQQKRLSVMSEHELSISSPDALKERIRDLDAYIGRIEIELLQLQTDRTALRRELEEWSVPE